MSLLAERYDKAHVPHQSVDGIGLINKLPPLTGSKVLDLGCGTGFLANVLAERVGPDGKVTAVDPDKERLRIARQKYGAQPNLEFLDGSSDSFPRGPYDTVFSTHVMHWIKDKESAFRKVYENLKVGGKFAFVYGEKSAPLFWQVLEHKVQESFDILPNNVYESIALKCGFEVEFKSVDPAKYTFTNIEEFINWVFASVNITIDPTTLEKFQKQFGAEPIGLDWIRVIFILKKCQ